MVAGLGWVGRAKVAERCLAGRRIPGILSSGWTVEDSTSSWN